MSGLIISQLEEKYKQLFSLTQKGDAQSYRELLEGVRHLLSGYLMKTMNPRLRSAQQVEDLVQEILISIHRKRDLYQVDLPFLPWVYAIARYRLIDSLRAEARRPECVEWIEKFDSLVSVEMELFPEEQDGEDLMEGLADRQKEILRLAKVEEISLQEIAIRFGISLSAVKVGIHRSIKQLRKKYEK